MHDVVIVGVPLFAILAGILLNRADVRELRSEMRQGFKDSRLQTQKEIGELRAEMNNRFNAVEARFNAVDAELVYFHGVTGKLDGRIEAIEKR